MLKANNIVIFFILAAQLGVAVMCCANVAKLSLDEIDMRNYRPGLSPLSSEAVIVDLKVGDRKHQDDTKEFSLDGQWQMAQGGLETRRLLLDWIDSIPAKVPGSVHAALVENRIIPDPTIGLNYRYAQEKSFKTWWFKKIFKKPFDSSLARLSFGGIAVKADVWLNGEFLGSHNGMFGGPEFDISSKLKDENVLIVRIHPAPFVQGKNIGWRYTVVFNNVYGWHYCNIPAIGIWRSVKIQQIANVEIQDPFVATIDAQKGEIDLMAKLKGQKKVLQGELVGTIEPENFDGNKYSFSYKPASEADKENIHLKFKLLNPKLWWPNDMGEQNLYKMKLSFVQDNKTTDYKEVIFGIRTVEMSPVDGRKDPDLYNWTFVINGKPMFVKGNGWCTMDPLMDFSYERYKRLITLAADQHIQMFRAWGSGMPETDEFYDLCNRYGIMVMQEWPTAWDSHREGWQPYELLEETVRLNMLRLRNNPSIVMWGGGNESGKPFGKAIDMMGRYSVELDGTRAFHRGEPWGGSFHNYDVYWGMKPLEHNLKWENLTRRIKVPGVFIGEFGVASMPVYESVQRYLPDEEKDLWPAPDDKSFAYHTPVFNKKNKDMRILGNYAYMFVPEDCSMEEFTVGSQLAQATGVRHTLELARSRWPKCTGSLYYKMNDNYPAASWSCVDWYGAPKISHFIFQDSFEPLYGCLLFDSFNTEGQKISLPVYLFDDADELKESKWSLVVSAYDSKLNKIKEQIYKGEDSINKVADLGVFGLDGNQTKTNPLLLVVKIFKNKREVTRTFYWTQFEANKGCLLKLPKTTLDMKIKESKVVIKNIGEFPAVGVNVQCPGYAHEFTANDNYFWLEPGEDKEVEVNRIEHLTISAWNHK